MQRARAAERNPQPVRGRGADLSAPRPTPLTLVTGAVARGDLGSVAGAAADALGCAVAIAVPTLGETVLRPPGSLAAEQLSAILAHAVATIDGDSTPVPAAISEAVAVRIGEQVAGIVAAAASGDGETVPERRPWLDAAAAAASVTAVIRGVQAGTPEDSVRAVLEELLAGPPDDLAAFLDRARRLGSELDSGAVALCARQPGPQGRRELPDLPRELGVLLAETDRRGVLGLAPLGSAGLEEVARSLREQGWTVFLSAPRRDAGALHQALQEADLLVELGLSADAQLAEQDETYRLLIGYFSGTPRSLRNCTPGRSLRWFSTTHGTTPICFRPCGHSLLMTAPRQGPPTPCACTATRSATGFRECTRSEVCLRMSPMVENFSAWGSRRIRSSMPRGAGRMLTHIRLNQ